MIYLPPDHLEDKVLREEIELLTDIIIATTFGPGRLSASEIDKLLGVVRDGHRVPAQMGLGSREADDPNL